MRISDWSSDACSSDLEVAGAAQGAPAVHAEDVGAQPGQAGERRLYQRQPVVAAVRGADGEEQVVCLVAAGKAAAGVDRRVDRIGNEMRSEEHTSELQSLMRNSYAAFCLKQKTHRRAARP